ncbi:MAG: hypothetical protein PHX51_05375 [Clostridia bacterium]|nr:hypothetical protein [Clostridia bacterium]
MNNRRFDSSATREWRIHIDFQEADENAPLSYRVIDILRHYGFIVIIAPT